MDFAVWEFLFDFSFVGSQVFVTVIADVDCFGAVVGEVVGTGAADSKRGVAACYYDDFALGSSM